MFNIEKILSVITIVFCIVAITVMLFGLRAEIVIAAVSGIIALIALRANIREGEATRKHNRLSVEPSLRFEAPHKEIDGLYHFKFILSNCGVGPAIIKTFVLIDDENLTLYDNFEDYNNFLLEMTEVFEWDDKTHLGCGISMVNGEKQTLWELKYDPNKKNQLDHFKEIKKLWVFVEYQSIYRDEVFALNPKRYKKLISKTLATAEAMAQIHAACFTTPRPWTVQEFVDKLKAPKMLCLNERADENNGSVIRGFTIGQWLDDKQVEILTLAINPDEQGKGLGQKMLDEFIAGVTRQGGKSIFLEVAENNAPALHLYEKAGFENIGIRPAYYKVPDAPSINAVVMHLDIKE